MKLKITKRHVLTGAAAALMPLAAGCGPAPLSVVESLPNTNARTAYMVNEAASGMGGLGDPVKAHGVAAATISRNGTLDQKFDTNDIHDTNGFTLVDPLTGTYVGSGGFAQVTPVPDVDGNGTPDDTFLVFTGHNPVSPQRTEYSVSYGGTRTDTAFVNQLRANDHKASYQGSASIMGSMSGTPISQEGDLKLSVLFTQQQGSSIDGRIDNIVNQGGTPPFPVNDYTFKGTLHSGSADYSISNFEMHDQAGATITNTTHGVGSFFGPRAGGTIGVIASTGVFNTQPVDLLTTFHASTQDNN